VIPGKFVLKSRAFLARVDFCVKEYALLRDWVRLKAPQYGRRPLSAEPGQRRFLATTHNLGGV